MSYVITIAGTGQRFDCVEGLNVLQGMMLRGREAIPVGCRGGGCGVCKVLVRQGRYRTGTMSSDCVSAEELKRGTALACKLFPETDLELDVVGRIGRVLARDSGTSGFHFYTGVADGAGYNNQED